MFKNEGQTHIQKLTTQVEKELLSPYANVRALTLQLVPAVIQDATLRIERGSFEESTDPSFLDQMYDVLLLIALDKLPQKVTPHQQTVFFEAVAKMKSLLVRSITSAKTHYAEKLLLTLFCTKKIYHEEIFTLSDAQWDEIDKSINQAFEDMNPSRIAVLVALRYILHPNHPRPNHDIMQRLRTDAEKKFESDGEYRAQLFALKLLVPEEFPQVETAKWTKIFQHTDALRNDRELCFLLLAASDLTVVGTDLRIDSPMSAAQPGAQVARPVARSI